MPHIISDEAWKRIERDKRELSQYWETGMTPDEVMRMMADYYDPAPLPMKP